MPSALCPHCMQPLDVTGLPPGESFLCAVCQRPFRTGAVPGTLIAPAPSVPKIQTHGRIVDIRPNRPRRRKSPVIAAWLAAGGTLCAGIMLAWLDGRQPQGVKPMAPARALDGLPAAIGGVAARETDGAEEAALAFIAKFGRDPPFKGNCLGIEMIGRRARVAFDDSEETEVFLDYDQLRKRWNPDHFSFTVKGQGRFTLPPRRW